MHEELGAWGTVWAAGAELEQGMESAGGVGLVQHGG